MDVARTIKRRIKLFGRKPVTKAVVREKLTYLSSEKLRRIERAVRETSRLNGVMVEFGVALGGSAIILAELGAPRKFVGLDVFGMIPPPTSDKDDVKSKGRYEVIRSGRSEGIGGDEYYGYKADLFGEVKAAFARHEMPVDGNRISLIKGLFETTWPSAGVTSISLAHIDCDWYDPVRYCLEQCADRLQDGGLIIIDDYNDYGGCRTAVDEFLRSQSDYQLEPGANPFLRKRSA